MNNHQHFGLFVAVGDDAGASFRPATEDEIVAIALHALNARIKRQGDIASPADSKALVALRLGRLEYEVFGVIFLDTQHRVIECREMFRGTLAQTNVYPRELLKEALALNAGAAIIYHCHPSGKCDPSRADEVLTEKVKSAFLLIDVRLLDHLIVGGGQVYSFAEHGLL